MNRDEFNRGDLDIMMMQDATSKSTIELTFEEQNTLLKLQLGNHYVVEEEIDVTPMTKMDNHKAWRVRFAEGTVVFLIRHDLKLTVCDGTEFERYVQQVNDYKKTF